MPSLLLIVIALNYNLIMGIISLELVLFIGVIYGYTRMRKHKVYPLEMIRNMTLYLPP